ncbi:ImmA/IrrE family metallo-endopeptidase [Georgenia sp. H159]|uniref:ImmA/IrrE family metallo-endopeptidase n=1 Tax=Georgenia sp. H159 TaxID=3076115 RepID=UPI002D793089|nr:ImmA/IrrE family metallo-endopeptidase [Georgenia sp. H159]
MSATADTAAGVWVSDYTTAGGVHVAGHWRRRRTGTADTSSGGGHGGEDRATRPHGHELLANSATSAASAETEPCGTGSIAPFVMAAGMGTAAERLAVAEERYRAAVVAAGVSSLQRRRGDLSADPQAAIRERREAKLALEKARVELAQQTVAVPDAEDGPTPHTTAGPARCTGCGQFRSAEHQCPTPAGLPGGDYAGIKPDERVKAMVADLETAVAAIVESGQLHRWLDAMASNGLSRWSANNRILATVQMLQRGESLEGLHMMGFRQWQKYNRQVTRGARAVWILAPVTRKILVENDDGTRTPVQRLVGFKSVSVFNISDTAGEDLPGPPVRPAPGEATRGTLEGLRERVAKAGYTYEESQIPGCRPDTGEGALGYTDPGTKRIVVDSRLGSAQKAAVIAHELGHVHCGHVDGDYAEYQRHRGQMETEAEMTSYLVSRSRGMTRDQVEAFSPGYIAHWSQGDPAVMHKAVDKATRAFNKIVDGTWPTERR